MATVSLESRLALLEKEVARLRQALESRDKETAWHRVVGTFANDPLYEEAMTLGRQYRESLRPANRKKKPKKK